jgi:hypothetical protein
MPHEADVTSLNLSSLSCVDMLKKEEEEEEEENFNTKLKVQTWGIN